MYHQTVWTKNEWWMDRKNANNNHANPNPEDLNPALLQTFSIRVGASTDRLTETVPQTLLGKPVCYTEQFACRALCNTDRAVHCSRRITEASHPGTQQLAWQQANRQTEEEEAVPRGACRLDESVCICWKGLSALCSCYCLTCETNSRSQGETEETVKEFIVTDFLTSKFFPLKLHSSLFTAGVPHVSWDGEKREEKLSQSNKNKR